MNVLSASRRTDLPAFYPERTVRQIMEIHGKKPVDAVVFWTKNAAPIIPYLDILTEARIPFYFNYTLNYYPELEPNVDSITERVHTFRDLSKMIGKERVVWRYDPLLISENPGQEIPLDKVLTRFAWIGKCLEGDTEKVVFSFITMYPKIPARYRIRELTSEEKSMAAEFIALYAHKYKMSPCICADAGSYPGIQPNSCIDPLLLSIIGAQNISGEKASGQRAACLCGKARDIGWYTQTCKHGCRYCYAQRPSTAEV
jgi:hypothetical protein